MAVDRVIVDDIEYEVAPLEPPRSEKPDSAYYAITRQVAEAWLKHNKANRTLRETASDAQSRDMLNHDWDVNGETIIFSRPVREGEVEYIHGGEVEHVTAGRVLLNDGQHRLEACASGGGTFITLVAFGVSPDSRRSIDSGIARKMHDVLKIDGVKNSPIVASLLRRMVMWDAGDRRFNGSKKKVTKAECARYLAKDPHGIQRAAEMGAWVRQMYKFVAPTVVAQAYYLTYAIAPEEAPWFFTRLRDGSDLSEGHPILALRTRFQNDYYNKKAPYPNHQLAIVLNAWNAHRDGRTLSQILQPREAATPTPK